MKTEENDINSSTSYSFIRSYKKISSVFVIVNLRLNSAIPISQSVYRKKRSTTEHVSAPKLIIGATISSNHISTPSRHGQSV